MVYIQTKRIYNLTMAILIGAPRPRRRRSIQPEMGWTLHTDAIRQKAFAYCDCKESVAIEWAIDTLNAMEATNLGAQWARLYRTRNDSPIWKSEIILERENRQWHHKPKEEC